MEDKDKDRTILCYSYGNFGIIFNNKFKFYENPNYIRRPYQTGDYSDSKDNN